MTREQIIKELIHDINFYASIYNQLAQNIFPEMTENRLQTVDIPHSHPDNQDVAKGGISLKMEKFPIHILSYEGNSLMDWKGQKYKVIEHAPHVGDKGYIYCGGNTKDMVEAEVIESPKKSFYYLVWKYKHPKKDLWLYHPVMTCDVWYEKITKDVKNEMES